MSAINLAILGMLMEKPRSAYELQKDVQYHHYDKWSKIASPTIYQNVHRLKASGYVQSRYLDGEKGSKRAVYYITQTGREYFYKLMEEYAEQQIAFLFDFNIVISNLNKIDRFEAFALLEKLEQNIVEAAKQNSENAAKYCDIPLVGRTIFQQQTQLYQALLSWLHQFQSDFAEIE